MGITATGIFSKPQMRQSDTSDSVIGSHQPLPHFGDLRNHSASFPLFPMRAVIVHIPLSQKPIHMHLICLKSVIYACFRTVL
ncbi:hypothetical protein SAMN03084138_00462 [Enterovibrio norvegicus DSM 15893]|uniref:Uncharacterized protein n=1 Tax=Enterovibrio norvegicus DSM 15893 TaxID=1121869 RepID=A0A1I5K0M7_9GAMM|nr:hypothetical protein SAMN03084138_00462 [Enterovibrio norvegicus DSM 15893]